MSLKKIDSLEEKMLGRGPLSIRREEGEGEGGFTKKELEERRRGRGRSRTERWKAKRETAFS